MGFYLPSTIVDDAKRHGIQVLPVDVLSSEWECTLEDPRPAGARRGPATTTRTGRYAVRMGLRYIKGLGEEDFRKVAAARRRLGRPGAELRLRPEESLRAFVSTSRLPRDALIALAESGAFRGFGRFRRDVLWQMLGSIGERSALSRRDAAERSLGELEEEQRVEFDRLDPFKVIGWDYESSGHSTFGHPVEPYREQLRDRGFPDAAGLSRFGDGEEVSYVGLIICRQMPDNAAGVLFVTMEDETGFVNLIVWPKAFERYRSIILNVSFLGVTGKIQTGDGVIHIIAERFWRPELSVKPVRVKSRDFH